MSSTPSAGAPMARTQAPTQAPTQARTQARMQARTQAGAWAARPAHRETLSERRLTATRSKPLEVTRYEDATIYDRLLAAMLISHRQHDAARIAHLLMLAAGLVPRMVARLDTLDEALAEVFEPDRERNERAPDAPTPRDRYRALMRRLGGARAGLVEALLLGEQPGRARLAGLAAALDALGDLLGLR